MINKALQAAEAELSRKLRVLAETTNAARIRQLNKEIDDLETKIKAWRK